MISLLTIIESHLFCSRAMLQCFCMASHLSKFLLMITKSLLGHIDHLKFWPKATFLTIRVMHKFLEAWKRWSRLLLNIKFLLWFKTRINNRWDQITSNSLKLWLHNRPSLNLMVSQNFHTSRLAAWLKLKTIRWVRKFRKPQCLN